jgi:oligopeptide transport system permease protein
MSAVIDSAPRATEAAPKSEGVWHAAWRRYRGDRVGMVSLAIVLGFLLLIALAMAGLVAKGWEREVGVPNAPPTFLGPRPAEATGAIAGDRKSVV